MTESSITANAVCPEGIREVTVSFDTASGLITTVSPAEDVASSAGILFPGFIDAHVHAREFPRPQEANGTALTAWEAACRKEVFATAGSAAINGGATAIAAMPNDAVPPDNPVAYQAKAALASSSPCPVILLAAVTKSSEPWADLPYKVYLDTGHGSAVFSKWSDLDETLPRYAGRRIFFHAEDPEILRKYPSGGPRWRTRPPEAEKSAIAKILELTAKLGLHTHICHVSTRSAVELIEDYNRTSSRRVTCEATPHHVFFSVHEGGVSSPKGMPQLRGNFFDCNPPLRSEVDRSFLLAALRDGRVDILATDHAPHTLADKEGGAPGMPHLDTLGGFVGWLIREGGFTPSRVAEMLSAGPARLFAADLDLPHGSIEPGRAASLTQVSLDASILVTEGRIEGRGPLRTRCGWSPFDGIPLPGVVIRTVIRGKLIAA